MALRPLKIFENHVILSVFTLHKIAESQAGLDFGDRLSGASQRLHFETRIKKRQKSYVFVIKKSALFYNF